MFPSIIACTNPHVLFSFADCSRVGPTIMPGQRVTISKFSSSFSAKFCRVFSYVYLAFRNGSIASSWAGLLQLSSSKVSTTSAGSTSVMFVNAPVTTSLFTSLARQASMMT